MACFPFGQFTFLSILFVIHIYIATCISTADITSRYRFSPAVGFLKSPTTVKLLGGKVQGLTRTHMSQSGPVQDGFGVFEACRLTHELQPIGL